MTHVAACDLPDAIFRTVAFFDVFDYCLTADEICHRLIGFRASRDEVLLGLTMCPKIRTDGMYFFLPGRDGLSKLRLENKKYHDLLWKKVGRWKWIFSLIPFVKGVYVCNTLAMTQARGGSDIDLLVVVDRRRLFIVRLFLLALTQFFGIRRHGNRIEGRFCLSFFVDEDHLDFSELLLRPYDAYFAYWLLLLRPIIPLSPSLLGPNEWVSQYFSGIDLRCEKDGNDENARKRSLFSPFWNFVESILSRWQLKRARVKFEKLGRPSGVVLEPYCLKFHDQDMREAYRRAWEKRVAA